MDFITKLEENHVIPTLATLQGDMQTLLTRTLSGSNGKYAGILEWDSSVSKFQQAIAESTDKPGQELVIGDFIKFGDHNGGFTKVSMHLQLQQILSIRRKQPC